MCCPYTEDLRQLFVVLQVNLLQLGSLPVVLVPLPRQLSTFGAEQSPVCSVVVSDKMSTLELAPATASLRQQPLALANITNAAPLWQQSDSPDGKLRC